MFSHSVLTTFFCSKNNKAVINHIVNLPNNTFVHIFHDIQVKFLKHIKVYIAI